MTNRIVAFLVIIVPFMFSQGALLVSAQSVPNQTKADTNAQTFTPSMVVAPSVTWTATTQHQTQWSGSAMVSEVKSVRFCDAATRQFGIVANAADSTTRAPGTNTVVLTNDDVRADYLLGIAGAAGTTQNYLSLDADAFFNNGIGVGLQQEYVLRYQRYLRPCVSTSAGQRFFASAGIGGGYVVQRLYATESKPKSAIVPVSAQFSYIVSNPKQAPKVLLSAQIGYTPFLNELRDYQIYGNASVQFPTKWDFLSIAFNEMDFYMNNAPMGFKRNYQSGSVQLMFSLGGSRNTPPDQLGACYSADTLAHLYCYDQVATSECSAPSVFRPGANCSAPAQLQRLH